MFEPLPSKFDFPEAEKRVLEFWDERRIFERSLEIRKDAPRFVFYEGPPTANGMPHPGHCLTRAIKDLFPRYRSMCGCLVERKAGWDTHGLPVEVEVCKELGIHTKEEIEAYGVEKFNRKCIDSVFRYTREWEDMTRRLGFWVNLPDAYVTFHQSYVESVWWGLKTLFERGLLYQGHKVVWWWAQGGTALSAGEVGEGYRTVDDPSVFVKFPLVEETGSIGATPVRPPSKTSLLVWTTTPWTLVSNHFAAVHPDLDYALVEDPGDGHHGAEHFYIAAALVESTAKKVKRELKVLDACKGSDLIGLRYVPPFNCFYDAMHDKMARLRNGGSAAIGWRVTAADFVTIESGTGLVHEAPAFGEVDFNLLQDERRRFVEFDAIPIICAVDPDGSFNADAPERYRGRWVKDCDKEIVRELRDERKTPWGTPLLYHQEQVRHEYPFCPRSPDDPLIQYARKSWFVRTSQFKDEFLKNNAGMNWLPEHIKEGRFGDFLRNNVDWALSRERYWGTPLPIWVCEQTGKMEAIGSFAELKAKPGASDATPEYPRGLWAGKKAEDPALPDHLMVHKPYIDAWTYDSPFASEGARGRSGGAAARMRRVPEVIDCWWDAGSMPYAQWGYPHARGSVERFDRAFPADFISEAIDQTRGWFYGLLSINTMLFGPLARNGAFTKGPEYPLPFRTCIVLGHMMGEDGNKMSKRLRNYREPTFVFDTYGADAMRWYFFYAQAPWTSTRFTEANIRDAQREFLVRLYNVLSFFSIYANIDGFVAHPTQGSPWRPTAQRGELDRWIISELFRTIRFVRQKMDAFENYPAAQRLSDFVDALSNWYVRRSRDRFWQHEKSQDKWDAYHTLFGVLLTLSKAIAPFTPFFAETMYQSLRSGVPGAQASPGRRSNSADAATCPSAGDLPESVHLCDYPTVDEALIDERLAEEMEIVRQITSLGRAARTAAKLKVRQPLSQVEIILAKPEHLDWLHEHTALIAEELNVKKVEFTAEAEHYVSYQIKPDFKAIGPKFGTLAPKIAAALKGVVPAEARRTLVASGSLPLTVDGKLIDLTEAEVEIRLEAKPGWSAAQGRAGVVVVSTEISAELRDEGLVRELIHHVQGLRKDLNLAYQARITIHVRAEARFQDVVARFADTIRSECLAEKIEYPSAAVPGAQSVSIEGHAVDVAISAR